ncbi:MAG: DUF4271 domain-containing protein [Paludibacteraceae bacterium]|nr:DUF4271 domain-containing protein [Paludibacteraceae bacterium]
MSFISRISTSYSEPWVAWVMLGLLVLLLVADFFQRGLIIGSFRSITATKERESLFSEVTKTTAGSIFIYMYEVGIVALAVYAMLFTDGSFSLWEWLIVVALVCLLSALHYLFVWLVCYVFLGKQAMQPIMLHYGNLCIVVSTLLYPLMLLVLFAPFVSHTVALVLVSVLAVFALIIWLIKAFRLFFTNFLAGFYIFLYLCTLEIVPLAGMVFVVWKWIM